jgi:hypothetical protein
LKLRASGYTWVKAAEFTGDKYNVTGKTVQEWVAKYKFILEAALSPTLAS